MSNQLPNKEPSKDQLKNLLDYTKFHIGLYATVVAAMITSLHLGEFVPVHRLRAAIICFLIAGAAGGTIASSICNYSSWEEFKNAKLGPLNIGASGRKPAAWHRFTYNFWANLEHGAFWLGVILLVCAYWGLPEKKASDSKQCPVIVQCSGGSEMNRQ